jgi:hypothetical protein
MWLEAVVAGLDLSVLMLVSWLSVRIGFLCAHAPLLHCSGWLEPKRSCVRGLVEEPVADCGKAYM